jgi:hypothetical protein
MNSYDPYIMIRGVKKGHGQKPGHIKECIECGISLDYGIGFCSFLCLEISRFKMHRDSVQPRAIDHGFFLEIVNK